MLYHVSWEIDVEAETPQEAAERARSYQTKPDASALVFNVLPGGSRFPALFSDEVTVDLAERRRASDAA